MKKRKTEVYTVLWFISVVIIFIVHFQYKYLFKDDVTFSKYLQGRSLVEFLKFRYETWSSRVIIEAVLVPICYSNIILWRILDTIMISVLAIGIEVMFGLEEYKKQSRIAFLILFSMIPNRMYYETGYIATSTNYLWTLALGLWAMYPIKVLFTGKKFKLWQVIIILLATVYSSNHEQMSAILITSYMIFGFVALFTKKNDVRKEMWLWYSLFVVVIICSIIFSLVAPGNEIRLMQETERYFPEFIEYSFKDKTLLGFITSLSFWTNDITFFFYPFLLGAVLLLRMVRNKALNIWNVCVWSLGFLVPFLVKYLLRKLMDEGILKRGLAPLGVITRNNAAPVAGLYDEKLVYLQICFFLLILICMFMTLYVVSRDNIKEFLFETLIISAGLCSKIMLGFSPTVYASGLRTTFFLTVCICILIMRNIELLFCGDSMKRKGNKNEAI